MRLLITGGCGFIGSNFIRYCLKKSKNNEIINLDALLSGSNSKNLQNIDKKRYRFVKGNICNKKTISKLIKDVDIVVNFAAESHVDRSIANSTSFVNSNILGVHNLLELLRINKHVKMIHISTDEVFGEIGKGTFFEKDCLNPSNPYSATKAAAEMLLKSYMRTYDLDITITRCVNNYGPRQIPEKLIPKVILCCLFNKPIPIHGNGKSQRQWIYVTDHCDAIWKIIQSNSIRSEYNIPGNYETDNLSLVKKILSLMNKDENLLKFVSERPGQDRRYSINSKNIKKDLNFSHQIDFHKGIKMTIDWYSKYKDWWKYTFSSISKPTPWIK